MSPRLPRALLATLCGVVAIVILACGDNEVSPSPAVTSATVMPTDCAAAMTPARTPAASAISRPATPEPTASTGSTPRSQLPLVAFDRQSGNDICLPVEVLPSTEFTIGLSGRYELDERGMLFYFGKPNRGSFWMKNTHVDLSIAFVGADSRIVEIREMKAESLEYVTPGADYLYAIEAQPGWYSRNGIVAGDQVRFMFELPKELAER